MTEIKKIREYLRDESGEINMIAIALLLIIVIALAVIFKDNITKILKDIFEKISNEIKSL